MVYAMMDNSVWTELIKGTNSVSVQAAETGQAWSMEYYNRFGGL